ncbi:DUF3558 domain-containing protein [Nocardia transvalensis]|uniref:DUF3558 domain-containing protein n=1 Tax=Nocardia transvalensis TaxID=37333 RepID=UPI00189493A2|nr:DUF3558 domain-containing protein [Nocardia transvalensis]MBF6333887.1 DUF3558 domain-containing protein [Nocardia transvalensis]
MASWGKVIRGAALGLGAVALVSGCNSGGGGSNGTTSASATPTIAPDVPAGFDACKGIPQSVIQSEHLIKPQVDTKDGRGGTKWRGCIWLQADDGYSATIDTTNITLAMVRANHEFTVAEELTVAGRAAITYRPSGQKNLSEHCLLNVEMEGGSLEISIVNPASRKTGNQDSCEIAKRLAQGIAPAIPAGA